MILNILRNEIEKNGLDPATKGRIDFWINFAKAREIELPARNLLPILVEYDLKSGNLASAEKILYHNKEWNDTAPRDLSKALKVQYQIQFGQSPTRVSAAAVVDLIVTKMNSSLVDIPNCLVRVIHGYRFRNFPEECIDPAAEAMEFLRLARTSHHLPLTGGAFNAIMHLIKKQNVQKVRKLFSTVIYLASNNLIQRWM